MRSVARSSMRPTSLHVRHLGTADALIDPAHHVSQDALDVVVEFALHGLGRRQIRSQRRREQVLRVPGVGWRRRRVLHRRDIDAVVVQHMQCSCRGRGHPCGVGARLRMRDLGLQHVGHAVGHGPHALADLRAARRSPSQGRSAHCVSRSPGSRAAALTSSLGSTGPAFHAGVDLVARAIEEARC